ncbi:MAG: nucleoside-diphosphate sugar epimerase/dehydratase [Candidatus Omnitrophica bacterium]|nr:nucleoside-diphosphate sugar epimerase/dehydratase [Candidatus Omnitrophota bacterium]
MNLFGIKQHLLTRRRFLVVTAHLFLIALAYTLAFLIRFDGSLPPEFMPVFFQALPLVVVTKLASLYFFDLFRGLWRYVGIADILQILKASVVATILFILANVFIRGGACFPRSIYLIDFMLFFSLVVGIRLSTRLIKERYRGTELPRNDAKILIVGAGETGVLILKQYLANPRAGKVVGFIDDDVKKHHESILGIKILGGSPDIARIVQKYEVGEILLAMPSAKGEQIRSVLSCCEATGAKIKTVPALEKIIDGTLEIKPRQVKLDDLLGREPVTIDKAHVADYIKNKRVLVTGAGGSIGSELCRQILLYNPQKIILLDHNENDVYFLEIELRAKFPDADFTTVIGDIQDVGLLRHLFRTCKPEVVFHAAAHKHVPLMEQNPIAAVKNNVIGTRNLLYAATHYGAERFVLISTDKAVHPTSIMGATKRMAEMILQSKAGRTRTRCMAVRFGNVIGSAGSVVPLFKKQIENGGPVTVTHPEVTRYFMSIPEAAAIVLQAGAIGKGGEIFILDMGEPIKIADLAKNLITLSGLVPGKDIAIQFTGLRAGEKLYEELLHDTEHDTVTRHNKIYVSQPAKFESSQLRSLVRRMHHAIKLTDEQKVVGLLTSLVPIQRAAAHTQPEPKAKRP